MTSATVAALYWAAGAVDGTLTGVLRALKVRPVPDAALVSTHISNVAGCAPFCVFRTVRDGSG